VQGDIDWHVKATGVDTRKKFLKIRTGTVLIDKKVELVVATGI
jgi:hypothetical protein